MFVDYTKIEVFAGKGGRGKISFRREKFVPKGGPNGGDGGRGGHVYFIVNPQLHTLQDIRYQKIYRAKDGDPGGTNQKTGKNGEDIRINVPKGTLIKNYVTGEIAADLVDAGQEFIVCRGGIGGKGNARFKTSTQQTPRKAQPGEPGGDGTYELELKVLADVGLVGLPNAGKSTLLSVVSSARPKVADYPFTTLQPHLGIVKYAEYKSFVMADIPGLIEGASKGKGLGHQFLRHVERNRLLLYMIDATEPDPQNVFNTLKNEVLEFNPDLHLKPYLIMRTKSDLVHSDINVEGWTDFKEPFKDLSSKTNQGVKELLQAIARILDEAK